MSDDDRAARAVVLDYTNWRGERRARRVLPRGLRFGATAEHAEPGWLLDALDLEKGEARAFALTGVHGWRAAAAEEEAPAEKGVCGLCGARVIPPALAEHELTHGTTSGHHYTRGVLDRVRCSPCALAEFRREREKARTP